MEIKAGGPSAFGIDTEIPKEEAKKMRRRDLKNLLTSYADEADIFAEQNQNAMDSVKTAYSLGRFKGEERPAVDIFIGRRSGDAHYYAVYDNGLGMEPEIAERFTAPGFSAAKKKGKTVGYKGVGASFFVAASERFSVWSTGASGALTEYTIKGSHSWIMQETAPEPEVLSEAELPEAVRARLQPGRGTVVCYFFHPGIKPNTLSHLVITDEDPRTEVKRWAAYLCAKTALGQLTADEDIGLEVRLHLDRGAGEGVYTETWTMGEFSLTDRVLGYPYPHLVLKVARDTKEIESLPVPKRDALQRTQQAVRRRWSGKEIQDSIESYSFKTEEQKNLVLEHLEFLDVFYAYKTDVLKELPARLGSRAALIKHGIRVGVDNVPQGRMLDFSFTSSIGLERQMHAVLSFKGLELDMGRKIPADEAVNEVARILTTRAQSYLKPFKIYLKKDTGNSSDPAANLEEWRQQVRDREGRSIVKKMFELSTVDPALCVDPENENDVIALFGGMLASNLVKGYKIKALSGINQYDGLIDIDGISKELKSIDDPLSVHTEEASRSGSLKVLEFKHNFDSLIRDFDDQIKHPKDIDLCVVWDIDQLNPHRGAIDYWFDDRTGYRELYAATHIWRDDNGTHDIPIISLRHVVTIILAGCENQEGKPAVGVAELRSLAEHARDAAI